MRVGEGDEEAVEVNRNKQGGELSSTDHVRGVGSQVGRRNLPITACESRFGRVSEGCPMSLSKGSSKAYNKGTAVELGRTG